MTTKVSVVIAQPLWSLHGVFHDLFVFLSFVTMAWHILSSVKPTNKRWSGEAALTASVYAVMKSHSNYLINTWYILPETTREDKCCFPLLASFIVCKHKAEKHQLLPVCMYKIVVPVVYMILISQFFIIRLGFTFK